MTRPLRPEPLRTVARLWRLSLAEWRAHPWRQAAAMLAVALGVALAFSVHLLNNAALSEFGAASRAVEGQPDGSVEAGPGGMDEAVLDAWALHPAVASVSPRVEVDTLALRELDASRAASAPGFADPRRLALRVLGVDAFSLAPLAPQLLPRPHPVAQTQSAGTPATQGLTFLDPTRVFVNPALAQWLNGAATLTLLAQGRPVVLQVGGTVAAGGPPLAVLDIAAAQALLGQPGRISRLDVRLAPGQPRAVPPGLVLPPGARWQSPDDANARMHNLSRAYRVNLTVLALVALVVGGFLVFSVVSLSVAQRSPSLALLGVLGLAAAERRALVLAECAVAGALASGVGLLLGQLLAAAALRWLAGDLGGGYFGEVAASAAFPWAAALGFGLLGTLAAVLGGWWPARQAAALAPAQALKGLGGASQPTTRVWPGLALLTLGVPLALLPPWAGLPLAAYASVAAWLVGGMLLVPWGVEALLRRDWPRLLRHPLGLLALRRARHVRATATATVAGVVTSLALCVALTVMVASFRTGVSDWLTQVLPADVYVRTQVAGPGDQVFFPPGLVEEARQWPGVRRVVAGRGLWLSLRADLPEVALQARHLSQAPGEQLPLLAPALPVPAGEVAVYVSEALRDLYHTQPGQTLALNLPGPDGPRPVRLWVAGVWRDYARQGGAVAINLADYQRLSADLRLNELALWLAPDATAAQVEATLRSRMQALGGDERVLTVAATAQIKAVSLKIFDRSFAVTAYLRAVAIAIGLAGVAASLSAQVLARRRELGLLVHLGLTRAMLRQLVLLETLCWLLVGVLAGVALGLAISVVLVHVVNPQSFHWTMDLHVPWATVAGLAGAVWLAGGLTSLLAARHVAGGDMLRAVREDN